MYEYFEERAEAERLLLWKHSWVGLFYNWVIVVLVVVLFFGFVKWGIDIHTRQAADRLLAETLAAMDAENAEMIAAAEAAERQAQQEAAGLQIREAQAIARALFGIRNFTEKYRYTNSDLLTYARCVTNRAEASGKSVEEVLAEPNQFTAYSDKNDLETELYDLALQFVADWHAGKLPASDTKYKYAALEKTGIWLVDDPKKDVPERWHA